MVSWVSKIISCKSCAKFWKTKTVIVLVAGIVIGISGLRYVPTSTAGDLAALTHSAKTETTTKQ